MVGHAHTHTCRVEFREGAHHHHHDEDDDSKEFQDAHELAHAQDIEKRLPVATVTTPQIVSFGLTGGLMPCPAAFTILLVCLHSKKSRSGFALVASFSFGLALTMFLSACSPRGVSGTHSGSFSSVSDAPRALHLCVCCSCWPPTWRGMVAGIGHAASLKFLHPA